MEARPLATTRIFVPTKFFPLVTSRVFVPTKLFPLATSCVFVPTARLTMAFPQRPDTTASNNFDEII